jgi:spore maturation protein CgeB
MTILLITETWNDATGPYDTSFAEFRGVLEAAGHRLVAVDNKANYLRFGGRTVWELRRPLRALGWVHWNNWIVNAAVRRAVRREQPDLVLITKGENLRWRTVRACARGHAGVVVNWDHDSPFWPENTSMDLLRSLPHLDCFFALGRHFLPVLLACGCPRAEYLPMYYNPRRLGVGDIPGPDRQRLASDILFVGRGTPERVAMLAPLARSGLALYGDWDLLPAAHPLRPCVRGRYLNARDYAVALRTCKIAVNALVTQCRGANNLRTFEATGCGAFLLTEHSYEQAAELFAEGAELACFTSPEDLRRKAEYYLAHEPERLAIAAAGQQRALREHTLACRLRRLIEVVAEIAAERNAASSPRGCP